MDSIGAEVGQKMRSAIKAKLMELGCYVDDELPDYIMVMVANKRTKTQMEDDLQLFLRSDTKVFVEWLQQVLKKLKEVTITNPEVCSSFKELKRKATMEIVEVAIKKEKKRKSDKKTKTAEGLPELKSLTDDIPVQAQKLVEKRSQNNRLRDKFEIKSETSKNNVNNTNEIIVVNEDNFDIPSLAEVNELEGSQLDLVEDKIKEARNRLVLMKSDSEDEDFINIRADAEELLGNELNSTKDDSKIITNTKNTTNSNMRILNLKRLNNNLKNDSPTLPVKLPMSERLGSRPNHNSEAQSSRNSSEAAKKRTRISLTESLREEQILSGRIRSSIQSIIKPVDNKIRKRKEGVHKRLGLQSAVVTLPKKNESPEEKQQLSVMSVVQVKPRRPLPGPCQANKKLLLKAVADAQRSIAQTPVVGKTEKDALFTKKYREKLKEEKQSKKQNKNKTNKDTNAELKNIIIQVKSDKNRENKNEDEILEVLDDTNDYTPDEVIKDSESNADDNDFIPNALDLNYDELEDYDETLNDEETSDEKKENENEKKSELTNHQFIVTLDGLKDKFIETADKNEDLDIVPESPKKPPKKAPSPIIFDKVETSKPDKIATIPEKLPKVPIPISVKSKERCKYWPHCRLKESCEFIHPNTPCKMFPMCKFGDKCLYIHPKCKFDASCTRKDCPYSHVVIKVPSKIGIVPRAIPTYHPAATPEICKFFPNCSNTHCLFYHPKPCRFGQYCLNKSECNFSHGKIPNKEKLTWHSNAR